MQVLARRMNEAVVQFVSDLQTGFVPDSFLPENTMLLQLLMDWVEEENEEAYLVFLDMEKAFDRCSWTFLIEGLEAIGFASCSSSSVRVVPSAPPAWCRR